MSSAGNLKLSVRNEEDLTVMSSCLQDALIAVTDMKFLAGENRFIFVANRFLWEKGEMPDAGADGGDVHERVHCGVCFENVSSVKQKGLNRERAGQIVSLLSVTQSDGGVDLVFSADVTIRLEISELFCRFQDIDEPWPTQWRPSHALDDADAD